MLDERLEGIAICLVLRMLWSRISGTKGTGGEPCRGDDALRPLAHHREGRRTHHHLSPHAAHVQSSLVLQQPRGSSHGGRSRCANSPYSALWVRSARQRGHFGCRANRKSSRLVWPSCCIHDRHLPHNTPGQSVGFWAANSCRVSGRSDSWRMSRFGRLAPTHHATARRRYRCTHRAHPLPPSRCRLCVRCVSCPANATRVRASAAEDTEPHRSVMPIRALVQGQFHLNCGVAAQLPSRRGSCAVVANDR